MATLTLLPHVLGLFGQFEEWVSSDWSYLAVFGVALPLLLWLIARAIALPGAFVLRFFAGFCLIANGIYIGLGAVEGIGDCGEMLKHGSAPWQLWLFGGVTAPIGLMLWHRLGAPFGLGTPHTEVSRGVYLVTLVVCLTLIALGFAVGGK